MFKIIFTNAGAGPAGKLADAELHFDNDTPLAGLKLIGFSVWSRRGETTAANVTFPARSYSVNGERRSFALLRPTGTAAGDANGTGQIRDAILRAYNGAVQEDRLANAERAQGVE